MRAGLVAVAVLLAGCSGSDASSESTFCLRAAHWIGSFSEDMTMGERGAWAAASSDLRAGAPDGIDDDLDVLATLGRTLQAPTINEDGVIEPLEITQADVTRAQENIAAAIEDACLD